MFQKLDLRLRAYWTFWDTHGTRILGGVAEVFGLVAAAGVVLLDADSKVAGALLAVASQLGRIVRARGQTNADLPPPPPAPPAG